MRDVSDIGKWVGSLGAIGGSMDVMIPSRLSKEADCGFHASERTFLPSQEEAVEFFLNFYFILIFILNNSVVKRSSLANHPSIS